MAWSWFGFALPLGLDSVEGTEASMLVAASASRGGWRRAGIAALAALVTLAPFTVGIYFAYKYLPGEYIDYAIASLVFLLGARELAEGLSERRGSAERFERPAYAALGGPLGVDPGEPNSVRAFQQSHGLRVDGVIGAQTRGAIEATLHAGGQDATANRLGVDITDELSISSYQASRGLPVDGVIGPLTQGALAADASRLLLDPVDPVSVKGFQRAHGLPESGVVEERTQAAARAIHALRGSAQEPGSDRAQEPDVTDVEAVKAFQRERGLQPSGEVDSFTQGALLAERARPRLTQGIDPGISETIIKFQQARSLAADGVIGPRTQRALSEARSRLGAGRSASGGEGPTGASPMRNGVSPLALDPADARSVRRFQCRHGLPATGEIGQRTRNDIKRERSLTAGVDITDAEAITSFQRSWGLRPTGLIGPETQGALRAARQGGQPQEDDQPQDGLPAWLPIDPASAASVKAFQHEHGLAADAVIGPETQSALRAVLLERASQPPQREDERSGIARRLGAWAPVWPAYVGGVLEGGEAVLYTFGVANGTASALAAGIGGAIGFSLPWVGLVALRRLIDRLPEWKVELSIGLVLMTAASLFGVLRATGIMGG